MRVGDYQTSAEEQAKARVCSARAEIQFKEQKIGVHMSNEIVENADSVEPSPAAVETEQPASAPAATPAVEEEPKPEPKPVQKKSETVVQTKRPAVPAPHAVSGAARDEVILGKCVFKNQWQRKSLTVHHVQRRLAELGHTAALNDKDGWYGDITREAVAEFQKACGIAGDGLMDAATFSKLFDGDINVNVNL